MAESLFSQSQPEACNFVKKETLTQVFPVNFAIFLRTPFLQKNFRTNASGKWLKSLKTQKVLEKRVYTYFAA